MEDDLIAYPLHSIQIHDLQKLGRIIWEWKTCGACSQQISCNKVGCPWSKGDRLQKYWKEHREMVGSYVPEFLADAQALTCYDNLLELVHAIKTNRSIPKDQLMQQIYGISDPDDSSVPTAIDQRRAMAIGCCILSLTDWRNSDCYDVPSEETSNPLLPWRDSATINEYMLELFPSQIHAYFSDVRIKRSTVCALSATRLHKAGFRIEATTDLRRHLEMDPFRKVVRMFDCVSALKEMLVAARNDAAVLILPRALLLEVLDTIQVVLFPTDHKSRALLQWYVTKRGLDGDLLRFEAASFRRDDDPDSNYGYFGSRLAALYDELQNPTPVTALERWFEKKSGSQRNMLMATMIGVFIAVIIGILGLGVAGFQAWVGYQQWKHPVEGS